MRRRPLLALAPLTALAACAGPTGPGADTAPASDGGAPSPSDGGASASDRGGAPDGGGSPAGADDAAAQAARARADQLEPRELAAQLVLIGHAAGSPAPVELLRRERPGGLFLLGVWESAAAVDEAVSAITEAMSEATPLLLAVDQEGGKIRMLRGDAARRTPDAESLGADGPEAVREAYTTIGEDLRARGLACALAPVADVVHPELDDRNAPVGALDRGFGTDPERVAPCVAAAVEALAAADVAATLKHFPGLGRVRENTDHSSEGIVDETTERGDPVLDVFAAGIEAGAELVMLSSALYPRLHEDVPAMFSSRIVTDVLRGDLGFGGLVVTDDIGAAKSVADVPVPERAVRVLEAGGDAVLTADPSLAGELIDAIAQWAQRGPQQSARVRESAVRMLEVKARRGLLDG